MLNVVLFQPENPHNTGAIGRTCALFTAQLHLIRPLGFEYPNRDVRRASMDYLQDEAATLHESWEAFVGSLLAGSRVWLLADRGSQVYSQVQFKDGDYLVFGRESDGLPETILESYPGLSIPMPGARLGPRTDHRFHSLNVSVSVAVALGEAARQVTENWTLEG